MKKEVTKYVVVDRPIEVFKDRIVNRYVDKIVKVDRPVEVIKEVIKPRKSPDNCVTNCLVEINIPAEKQDLDSEDEFEIID